MDQETYKELPVFQTVAEAYRLIWALCLPYIILSLLGALPNVAAVSLGMFEGMDAFISQAQNGGGMEVLRQFPVSETLIALVLGFAVLSAFGIFWYRYLLLGQQGALKFGVAEFGALVLRFSAYGLMVMGVWMFALVTVTLLGCTLGAAISHVLGQSGTTLAYAIQGALVFMAYFWVISFAVRTALIFSAMAVGRPITLSEAWVASKDSAGGMIWTILVAGVPLVLLSMAVRAALSPLVGVDLLAESSALNGTIWWLDLALAPVANLSLAAVLAVIAIAYRELCGARSPADLPGGATLA